LISELEVDLQGEMIVVVVVIVAITFVVYWKECGILVAESSRITRRLRAVGVVKCDIIRNQICSLTWAFSVKPPIKSVV